MERYLVSELRILVDPVTIIKQDCDHFHVQLGVFEHYLRNLSFAPLRVQYVLPMYVYEAGGGRGIPLLTLQEVQRLQGPSSLTRASEAEEKLDRILARVSNSQLYRDVLYEYFGQQCTHLVTEYPDLLGLQSDFQELGIRICNHEGLFRTLEVFARGFHVFVCFESPTLCLDMDTFYTMTRREYHSEVPRLIERSRTAEIDEYSEELIRSMFYNRYPDILYTRDMLKFYVLQRDLCKGLGLGDRHRSMLRYYFNYYYYLLWGALDHFAWIVNGIMHLGFNRKIRKDRERVGLRACKQKENFLRALGNQQPELEAYIRSKEFQGWLGMLSALRHPGAHVNLFTPSPLLQETDESSSLTDEEIDQIIYDLEEERIYRRMPSDMVDWIRRSKRYHYRLSRMKVVSDIVAYIEEPGGQKVITLPVAKIDQDLSYFLKLLTLLYNWPALRT